MMQLKKDSLPEIEKIVQLKHSSVVEHRKMIEAMIKFSDTLIVLAQNECPEFAEKAKQIAALLHGVMDQESIIAKAEERLAEDLNDISVRYDLLYKVGAEIQSKRSQLVATKNKISDLYRSIEHSKASGTSAKTLKYQGDLAGAKQKKAEVTKQLEDLLQRFIDLRQRYNKFKVRRLEHGYNNLGETVAKALEIEKHLLGQLQRDCIQARDNLDDFFEDQLTTAQKLAKKMEGGNAQEGEDEQQPEGEGEQQPEGEGEQQQQEEQQNEENVQEEQPNDE